MGIVEDRFELLDLMARYAAIPDAKNFDGVYDVFADEVVWDFESAGFGPPVTRTPATTKDWLLPGFTGFNGTHHAITNHRITVDGDRATIHAHIHAEHWIDPADAAGGPICWLVTGFYDDEAVRTPNGWRLTSVRLTVTHNEGMEIAPIARAIGMRKLGIPLPPGVPE